MKMIIIIFLCSIAVNTNQKHRQKRQDSGIKNLCEGGMGLNEAYGACSQLPKLKCKVKSRTCHKYVICDVAHLDNGNGQPPVYLQPLMQKQELKEGCFMEHIYKAIVCCEYICPRP